MAAARAAGELLASLRSDVEEVDLSSDKEVRPAWGAFMAGTSQHLIRVVERLHGGRVEP